MRIEGKTTDPDATVAFYFIPQEQLTHRENVYIAGMKYAAHKGNIVLISQVRRWIMGGKVEVQEA